jgi:hypothetical protein
MKVYQLDIAGLRPAYADIVTAKNGVRYYAIHHGDWGRGRWEVRFPLAAREFIPPEPPNERPSNLGGVELKLVDLHRQDPRGNQLYLLARGESDGTALILWSLNPGFRGGAEYNIKGQARVIALGREAQGAAGRMGGADCPVVHVTGPCRLEWTRTGRLYGNPADWVAEFNGSEWVVGPAYVCAAEEAALNY